jgi:hypothetical protein
MPAPSTSCPHCGKLFFAHSLGMHTSLCASKMARQLEACPACGQRMPRAEMRAHISMCKAAHECMGLTLAEPSPSKKREKRVAATSRAKPKMEAKADVILEPLADGRVPCSLCGRCFAPDRIIKHQLVCLGPSSAKRRPTGHEGQKSGEAAEASVRKRPIAAARGRSATARPSRGAGRSALEARKPVSRWRAASEELQKAMKAAREGAKLDKLRDLGLTYHNGKPKPGVTPAMLDAALRGAHDAVVYSTSSARQPESVTASRGSPGSSGRLEDVEERERLREERLGELEEVRELISQAEYDSKLAEILMATRGGTSHMPRRADALVATARSPPSHLAVQSCPPRASTQRPPPRPVTPSRAQRAHAAEYAALQEASAIAAAAAGGCNSASGGPFAPRVDGWSGGANKGAGGASGGGLVADNRTSPENPFYRGY